MIEWMPREEIRVSFPRPDNAIITLTNVILMVPHTAIRPGRGVLIFLIIQQGYWREGEL